MQDFASTWKSGIAQQSARISFATPELLWKLLTAKRWELLKVLCGAGPVSIREAARRAGRDVKAVPRGRRANPLSIRHRESRIPLARCIAPAQGLFAKAVHADK
jgi:hypothetical protein